MSFITEPVSYIMHSQLAGFYNQALTWTLASFNHNKLTKILFFNFCFFFLNTSDVNVHLYLNYSQPSKFLMNLFEIS